MPSVLLKKDQKKDMIKFCYLELNDVINSTVYWFLAQGQLKDATGSGYQWDCYVNTSDKQARYDGVIDVSNSLNVK